MIGILNCRICRNEIEVEHYHGNVVCKKCNTEYEFIEGFAIKLSESDLEMLKNKN